MQFYVSARTLPDAQPQALANVLVPVLAGEARVVLATNLSSKFPAFQALGEFRHVTSGLDSFVSFNESSDLDTFPGWVPVGDDILTLLDACASGLLLSVDVHNLRGLRIRDPTFGNLQNPALFAPFINSLNLSQTCPIGFPPAPTTLLPQGVLFNAPLRCPPLLTWLGKLRAQSSYFNSSSNNRLTFDNFTAAFGNITDPAQRKAAILRRLVQGDLDDRAAVLSELMISKTNGKTCSVNATAHYETCAPATCLYTEIKRRTVLSIVNTAMTNYGGVASSIIMVFSSLTLYSSFFMYKLKIWRAQRREADELRSAGIISGKMAGVLVTNPAVLH